MSQLEVDGRIRSLNREIVRTVVGLFRTTLQTDLMRRRILLAVAVLLVSALGAGCFGPEEDPSTEVEGEETTPGDETVEAGGEPQGEPVNDTANVEGTTTAPDEETTNGDEDEADG